MTRKRASFQPAGAASMTQKRRKIGRAPRNEMAPSERYDRARALESNQILEAARRRNAERSPQERFDHYADGCREAIENGNGAALIATLSQWASAETPILPPKWLAEAIKSAENAYRRHKVRTLDEAFKVARPKGYHRAAAEKEDQIGCRLTQDVLKMRAEGVVLDEDLFAAVGALYDIGKTKAAELYYEQMDDPILGPLLLSRSLEPKGKLPPRLERLRTTVKWHAPGDSAKRK